MPAPPSAPPSHGKILLTGSTGYVGGRLRAALEARGEAVRCLARRPEGLAGKVGARTEVALGDVLAPETLAPALAGIDTAFYLIHSMGSEGDFEETDRRGAHNFAEAARRAEVRRIVYLGALASSDAQLSAHLVERLPVMITPRWVDVLAQPIGIDDLVQYLVESLEVPLEAGIVEIGGPEAVSYGDLMREYARQRGLRRFMLRVPVLTPRLSSLWLGLVTPLYARVGRKLIESIRHPTVVNDPSAAEHFSIHPVPVAESIARALAEDDRESARSRWCDALSSAGEPRTWTGVSFGQRLVDSRTVTVPVSPRRAFAPIRRIGGRNGWYAFGRLWRLRGFLDLLAGGVGTRRGRPHPEQLGVGDALDFWRVEAFEPDRRLRLCAEMKVPGRAWLEFEVSGSGASSTIRQTAIFDPVGLGGLAYWYLAYPLHALVFAGMLRGIARRAVLPEEGSLARA